jgi:hypothetical protein
MSALAGQLASQRAIMAAWIVDGIMQRATLRSDIDRDQAINTIWLLMDPAVSCHLTRSRAWTSERFEAWFTDSIPDCCSHCQARCARATIPSAEQSTVLDQLDMKEERNDERTRRGFTARGANEHRPSALGTGRPRCH